MSRSTHTPTKTTVKPKSPSVGTLLAMLIVAAVFTSIAIATLFSSDGYPRSLLIRTSVSSRKSWITQMQQLIAEAPLDRLTQTEWQAHRRAVRVAADYVNGDTDIASAAAEVTGIAVRDPRNGLTQWINAWLTARSYNPNSDPVGMKASIERVLDAVAVKMSGSTYERQELSRTARVLAANVQNPFAVALLTPKEPETDLADALPLLVNDVLALRSPLTPALAAMLGSAIRDDPSPPTALLLANMLERLARAVPAPASAPADPRWPRVADDAAAFQRDLRVALDRCDLDPLDRRPIPAAGSLSLSKNITIALACTAGLMITLLAMARAALTVLYAPTTHARSRHKHPIQSDTEPVHTGWKRLWLVGLMTLLPLIATCESLERHLRLRGPSYQMWPFIVAASTLISIMILTHFACRLWLIPRSAKTDAATDRTRDRLFLACGAFLALFPFAPPVWSSYGERAAFWLREHYLGWPLLILAVIAVGWLVVREAIRNPPPGISARSWFAAGVFAWFLAATFGIVLTDATWMRDRFEIHRINSASSIKSHIGDDWLVKYFDKLPDSPPWGTPTSDHTGIHR